MGGGSVEGGGGEGERDVEEAFDEVAVAVCEGFASCACCGAPGPDGAVPGAGVEGWVVGGWGGGGGSREGEAG